MVGMCKSHLLKAIKFKAFRAKVFELSSRLKSVIHKTLFSDINKTDSRYCRKAPTLFKRSGYSLIIHYFNILHTVNNRFKRLINNGYLHFKSKKCDINKI